ncbi:hypothetical protein I2I05_12895 [Hymenobacter sp. BT683]|uniref:DUF5723 domain-containing protein n=1 Tax=Hymenobacter jeongseonensis TaxID=2791027 RepID=A0ABS0IKL0_9BACT|nr:DUF5723 family protein [Hymenobacter jeongseonensis]MBF9238295.1 hypothetical protein [Hymenobacter jeongseonensis]
MNPLRLLPLAALLALPAAVWAQIEPSNFSATGRGGVINTFAPGYQAIGVNPANLGREGESTVSFTIGELGLGVGSRSLSKTLFERIIFERTQSVGPAERAELVDGFSGDNAFNFNLDATSLGVSVALPYGLGGLAFSNRQRMSAHLAMNRNAADVIVNGKNAASIQPYYPTTGTAALPPPLLSEFLDGTAIQLAWTSEYNISYGMLVVDKPGVKLTAGAGYRYIQGIGIADIRAEDGKLDAYSALSPIFGINYGSLTSSPNFNYETGSGLNPVGRGHGYDLGLAAEVGKFMRFGVSVTDLGSMTWKGNVVTAADQELKATTATGIDSYDVLKEVVDQFDTNETNLFDYDAQQKRKADLPGKLRVGVGVRISSLFEAGIDFTAPLNKVSGNLTSPFMGLGVDYKPVRWLRLSSGVSGGAGYGANFPLGVTLVTPIWEAGVSSRDVLGYLSEKSPHYSLALGFLRFNIGRKE